MVGLTARTAACLALTVGIVALASSCGSSTTGSPAPSNQITGAASCPAAESQDLTFSGAVTGHLICATSQASCGTSAGTPSLTFPLNARLGSNSVQLLVAFRFFREHISHDQPGTYLAGKLGEGADSKSFGVTLDGLGHWETPTPGGSMTLTAEDAAGASGALDVKLTDGTRTFALGGSWRCAKAA